MHQQNERKLADMAKGNLQSRIRRLGIKPFL
jgi:hypothetical protein